MIIDKQPINKQFVLNLLLNCISNTGKTNMIKNLILSIIVRSSKQLKITNYYLLVEKIIKTLMLPFIKVKMTKGYVFVPTTRSISSILITFLKQIKQKQQKEKQSFSFDFIQELYNLLSNSNSYLYRNKQYNVELYSTNLNFNQKILFNKQGPQIINTKKNITKQLNTIKYNTKYYI